MSSKLTVLLTDTFQVIALICSFFVDLLMLLSLLSTNWLTTNKYRQGLWQYCIETDSPRPLPFGLQDGDGCHWGRDAGISPNNPIVKC